MPVIKPEWARYGRCFFPVAIVLITMWATFNLGGLGTDFFASNSESIPSFAKRNAAVMDETTIRNDWIQLASLSTVNSDAATIITRCDAELTVAIEEDATDDVLWHNRAWTQRLLGHANESDVMLDKAIQLAPFDFVYRASRTLFAEWDRDPATAKSSLAKTLELAPPVASSLFFRDIQESNPAIASDAMQEALTVLERMAGDPLADAKRARLLSTTGNLVLSEALVRQSLSQLPNLGGAWRTLAMVQKSEGKPSSSSALNAAYLLLRRYPGSDNEDPDANPAMQMGFQYTPHSNRFSVRYHVSPGSANDVFPEELLRYISQVPDANM